MTNIEIKYQSRVEEAYKGMDIYRTYQHFLIDGQEISEGWKENGMTLKNRVQNFLLEKRPKEKVEFKITLDEKLEKEYLESSEKYWKQPFPTGKIRHPLDPEDYHKIVDLIKAYNLFVNGYEK